MTDPRAGARTLGRSEAPGSASRLGQAQLRQVFAAFPTGVAAVAAIIDGEPAAGGQLVRVGIP